MPSERFTTFFKEKGRPATLDLTLTRIENAVRDAGFSAPRLGTVVHIAGTNGKGSTASFLSQMLQDAGYCVALFTSPALVSVREHIRINNTIISQEAFDAFAERLFPLITRYSLSEFEALFLIALAVFQAELPDVTILETGLGGTTDATNIAEISHKIPVITSLSLDHQEYLGNTLADIVRAKCGIVRGNTPVFAAQMPDATKRLIQNELSGTTIIFTHEAPDGMYPSPYGENYALAKQVAEYIAGKDLPHAVYPLPACRREQIGNVLLDGAHNEDGFARLLESLPEAPKVIILSCAGRDVNKLVDTSLNICNNIIVTGIPGNTRSIRKEQVDTRNAVWFDSPTEALAHAQQAAGDALILCAGSLYLCAHIRALLTGEQP